MDNAEISKEIDQVVSGWWDRYSAPILLSKLGSLLPYEVQSWVRDEKVGLKRFIEEAMPSIRVVKMDRHGGGVVPKSKVEGVSDEEIEKIYDRQRKTVGSDRIPSYDGTVWRAFKIPLDEDERRFLRVGLGQKAEVRRTDSANAPVESDWVEVTADDLSHLSESIVGVRDIHHAIQKWAEGKISPECLVRPLETKLEVTGSSQIANRAGNSDFVALALKAFTREELSRINIPADILLSLLERGRRER